MASAQTEAIKKKLEQAFEGLALKCVCDSLLLEKGADLPRVMQFLKEDPELAFDYLSSVTGSDYLTYLESVYHLFSMQKKTGALTLRVRTDRDNPEVPSVTPIFRGAEFQERESYDMYGIRYTGHPDLRRIFMWEHFEGFPMRKDFVQEDSEALDTSDREWLRNHNVQVAEPESAQPSEEGRDE